MSGRKACHIEEMGIEKGECSMFSELSSSLELIQSAIRVPVRFSLAVIISNVYFFFTFILKVDLLSLVFFFSLTFFPTCCECMGRDCFLHFLGHNIVWRCFSYFVSTIAG